MPLIVNLKAAHIETSGSDIVFSAHVIECLVPRGKPPSVALHVDSPGPRLEITRFGTTGFATCQRFQNGNWYARLRGRLPRGKVTHFRRIRSCSLRVKERCTDYKNQARFL